jgi:ABC-type phosphate/phosphonate transport system ATPase subunit
MATAHGEVVIAILGVTGAGKSSLVKRVTNRNDIYVEDGLSSGLIAFSFDGLQALAKFSN